MYKPVAVLDDCWRRATSSAFRECRHSGCSPRTKAFPFGLGRLGFMCRERVSGGQRQRFWNCRLASCIRSNSLVHKRFSLWRIDGDDWFGESANKETALF